MLSVIITVYNQTEIAIKHIEKCMEQTILPDEIVVVNDGGKDFRSELGQLKIKCPIIYATVLEDKLWNQNGARNLGIYLSRGDVLSFEDNDHIPFPKYYEEGLELLKTHDVVVLKKRYVISDLNTFEIIGSRGKANIITLRKRKDVLAAKGFDEQFCGNYGWDVPDFVNRVGGKIIEHGECWVVNVLSSLENRDFFKGGVTKMAPTNYHHYRRNIRQNNKQSPIGILNFRFTFEEIFPNTT